MRQPQKLSHDQRLSKAHRDVRTAVAERAALLGGYPGMPKPSYDAPDRKRIVPSTRFCLVCHRPFWQFGFDRKADGGAAECPKCFDARAKAVSAKPKQVRVLRRRNGETVAVPTTHSGGQMR